MGIIVFLSKKLDKIGPRHMLIYLMGSDAIYLLFIAFNYSSYTFGHDISSLSDILCKMYFYFNYALDPISSILLVYISVDRYVSIKYPEKRKFLRKSSTQLVFLLITVVFNLCLYCPSLVFTYVRTNKLNVTFCTWINGDIQNTALIIDTVNRLVIPFLAMLICNTLLIYTIFKSRNTILTSTMPNAANKTLKKDLKFSVTIIFLNFIYIFLNIPLIVVYILVNYDTHNIYYYFTFYLWYLCYAVNFYLILFTNNSVRKHFYSIL